MAVTVLVPGPADGRERGDILAGYDRERLVDWATPLTVNVTMPVGVPLPVGGMTVAVNVTVWPGARGLAEELSVVVVAARSGSISPITIVDSPRSEAEDAVGAGRDAGREDCWAVGMTNSVMAWVVGSILPIWLESSSVNQRSPSGPAVMPSGRSGGGDGELADDVRSSG